MKTPIFKQIWKFLDGNKSIICLGTATVLQQAIKYDLINDSKMIQFTIGLTLVLGGGSIWHHAKKGYFSGKKGN
jgi:hypothetical protein